MPSPAAMTNTALPAPFTMGLQGTALALLTAGCFLPTEGASQGDTLWLAILWLATAALAACSLRPSQPPLRWRSIDTGAALFVGGHILSGVLALNSGPDRCTASILLVEWIGLAAAWFALRTAFAETGLPDQVLSIGVLLAATLSIYGMWQTFVWYPSMAAEFGPKMELVRQLGPDAPAAAAAVRELRAAEVPTEGSALILFEKRLRDSREPFGLFALANTFGGFLAVWLLAGVGLWRQIWSAAWWKQGLIVALLLLIAACLWLTNSRTAWGGLIIGLTGLAASRLRQIPGCGWMPLMWIVATGVAAFGVVLYGIAGDWQHTALPGPLKSLVYRFQYWRGTWGFLQDDWLFGAGLGQFRGAYAAHKLPEASEEIADPHDLWLDAWSNGGLPALVGLILLFGTVMAPLWRRPVADAEAAALPTWNPILAGAVAAGMMLAFLGPFLLSSYWNDAPLVLLFAFAVLLGLTSLTGALPVAIGFTGRQSLCALGAVALGTHLVGAGGIGMPAVAQCLFVLAVGTLPPAGRPLQASDSPTGLRGNLHWGRILASSALIATTVLATVLVVRPVHTERMLVEAGDDSAASGRYDFAGKAYREAAAVAPLASEPWLRIASLEELAWKNSDRRDESRFEAAAVALEAAWQRNSASHPIARQAAQLWSDRAAATGAAGDLGQAVDWATRAVNACPTNAVLTAELALALAAAGDGDTARDAAARALRQQATNAQQGHVDRYLSPEVIERLSELCEISKAGR